MIEKVLGKEKVCKCKIDQDKEKVRVRKNKLESKSLCKNISFRFLDFLYNSLLKYGATTLQHCTQTKSLQRGLNICH